MVQMASKRLLTAAAWAHRRKGHGPGRRRKSHTAVADFSYTDTRTGLVVVEDVKGFKTPLYRWKKRHVEAQYGFRILET